MVDEVVRAPKMADAACHRGSAEQCVHL